MFRGLIIGLRPVEKGQAVTNCRAAVAGQGFLTKKGGTKGYRQSMLRFREEILADTVIAQNAAVQQYIMLHCRYVLSA
jgi:hypothetical protein